jgi:outer membrane protein assembly factor BamB
MKRSFCIFHLLLAVGLALLLADAARAVQVQIELVAHDQPDVTVDKLERERPILEPVVTDHGVEMQKVGLDLACWARNVLLDGQPIFERYHEGKYIDRLPVARPDLAPGRHVLWPGDHAFAVAEDGSISSDDPELIIEGTTVRLKCYPVTIRAFRANPEESELPLSMRTASLPNLTVRESTDAETNGPKAPGDADHARELLPVFDSFAPLTIYLPANVVAKGYLLHPVGLTFHLTPEGVAPGAGGGQGVDGLRTRGSLIEIPLYGFPVYGAPRTRLNVSGVEQFRFEQREGEQRRLTNWYPRRQPYELKLSETAAPLAIDGDLGTLPVKSIRVDIGDPVALTPRGIVVELASRRLKPGGKLEARISALDAAPAVLAERAARATTNPAEVEALKQQLPAAAANNPLASAAPFAQIQAYGGGDWADVPLAAAGDGRVSIDVPALADGIYRLRVGVRPADDAKRPIFVEEWVSIAADRAVSLGLFTQRGRDAFYRGEPMWFGLTLLSIQQAIPAGAKVEVDLVDASGKAIPLHRGAVAGQIEPGGYDTIILRLDADSTAALAAGRYTLAARLNDAQARPMAIEMVEPEPRTNFTNLLNGKYNAMGVGSRIGYAAVVRTGEGAEQLAREMADMGYNAFTGMSYGLNRMQRTRLEIEQLVRDTPALGPWESYYQPAGRDRFMNAAVRQNIRFYEDIFTYNDTMLPREPLILRASERYMALEMLALRFSPAFRGACLYDEFYDSADTGTTMSQIFFKAQEFAYRQKHPGITSADATKAMDRFTGRPFGQRRVEDLNKFRTWMEHQDSDWAEFCRRMANIARAIMPSSTNLTQQRFWGANGGNIDANGATVDIFRHLEIAMPVMYKDGGLGDRPVFAPMQADALRVRDDLKVWTQLHNYHAPGLFGDHLIRQAFFAISQKIEGFSFFTIDHDVTDPHPFDGRETVRNIAGALTTPYGDFFIAAQRGYKQVAVYYSRKAHHVGQRKPNRLTYQCEGLWVAAMRAGYPADYLYDEQVLAGKGAEYQVIFVPGIYYEDETPPEILAALKKLVDSGKTIIVERSSKLPLDRVVRLDSELDEYDGRIGTAFPRFTDFETRMVFEQTENMTRLLRQTLPKYIKPAAEHDLLVGPDWLRCGAGAYLVIPNFAPTQFTGLYRTLYQAPDRPTLRFPMRSDVVYDMLEMKRVEAPIDGDWQTLAADMRQYPGKIYAFLPAEIDRVSLRASATVQGGSAMQYAIDVRDAQGQVIDAGFPIEIQVLDPQGNVVHHIYRAAAPQYAGAFTPGANAPAGVWKIRVRELISGAVAEAGVNVTAGSLPAAKIDERPVWLYDAAALRRFIEDKTPVLIAVDEDQAWLSPQAERLRQMLHSRGREAKVVQVADVLRAPADWDPRAPRIDGSRLWRGDLVEPGFFIDAPVIVLGKRYESRLIESLERRGVLPQPMTTHFPAPGQAMVGWTRTASSVEFDTAWVLANDEAGLARGIDALLAPDPAIELDARPAIKLPQPDPAAQLAASGAPQPREPSSLADKLTGGERVRSLGIDPATGRTLVGTFGYGHNLFCFDASGKLLWKQFLPEHDVIAARFYDSGRRVAAVTSRGCRVFLIDAATGNVIAKFASSEWPNGHGHDGFWEGATETMAQLEINEPHRQILCRGMSGIIAVDFDGKKLWFYDRAEAIASYPREAEQSAAAAFNVSVVLGNFALSPDGTKLVVGEEVIVGSTPGQAPGELDTIWRHVVRVLDAKTGKVLLENNEDPGNRTSPGSWSVAWPVDSPVPLVRTANVSARLKADGTLEPFVHSPGHRLPGGGRVAASPTSVERLDAGGAIIWHTSDPRIFLPDLDALSPDASRLYRCDRDGGIRCIALDDGRVLWEAKLPFQAILQPTADGVIAGTSNGTVASIDNTGKILWTARLRDLHELPERDFAGYIAQAKARDIDLTPQIFPTGIDAPGDYDAVFRFGIEQLAGGDFESKDAWAATEGDVTLGTPAHGGATALKLSPGRLVTQRVARRLVQSGTYLLEFHYRPTSDGATLVAGALVSNGSNETFTGSRYGGKAGEWRFGRLAIKTMADSTTLDIGFEAVGGEVMVDDVSLRPIRFPSPNFLADSELHAIEPTFVRDIRVQYDRIPSALRQKLSQRNRVAAFRQGNANTATIWTQEEAFIHNGRLDDVGESWAYQPDNMGFSAVLTKPAYVSHVVLYLNNALPDTVYRTISVVVNDLDTKLPREAALIRGNERRFIVARFDPPIYTDLVKVLPGFHGGHREVLTELELYGPLGGPDLAGKPKSLPSDPDAMAMFMGNPAHVPAKLPADVTGELVELYRQALAPAAYYAGSTAADHTITYAEAAGVIRSFVLPRPDAPQQPQQQRAGVSQGPTWPLASITPTSTPARYAGRGAGGRDARQHPGPLRRPAARRLGRRKAARGGRRRRAPVVVPDRRAHLLLAHAAGRRRLLRLRRRPAVQGGCRFRHADLGVRHRRKGPQQPGARRRQGVLRFRRRVLLRRRCRQRRSRVEDAHRPLHARQPGRPRRANLRRRRAGQDALPRRRHRFSRLDARTRRLHLRLPPRHGRRSRLRQRTGRRRPGVA